MIIRYDGGRSTSKRPLQHSDCCVITTAIAFDITYDFAFYLLKYFAHRKDRDGVTDNQMKKVWTMLGTLKKVRHKKNILVMEAVKLCRKGTYIISTTDHMVAVKDGKIYDVQMTKYDLLTSEVEAIYKIFV